MRGKGEGSIYQDARGLWTGTIELPTIDGTRRRKVIRRKKKQDLLDELATQRVEYKRRGDLVTHGMTVGQWFTQWFDHIASREVRPNTLAGYRTITFKHVIPTIGTIKLAKVNGDHVRRVTEKMLANGSSSTYALLAHRTMAIAFRHAIIARKISVNPITETMAPRKAVANLEAFNLEEALAVLEHVSTDRQMGARWATALLTGARRGEVLGLQWDRVTDVLDLSWQLQAIAGPPGKPNVPADFEYKHLKGVLYLTRPKSNKGWRIIPLVDPLKSILERHHEDNPDNEWGLVFTSRARNNPIDPARDTRKWKELLKETKIDKRVRLHDLRHTAVDLLSLAGLPDDVIMAIVGHSTRAMTQAYKSRMDKEVLVAAMQQYSALFTKPTEGTSPAIDQ